jgi:ketosteroid isomerase-like protein
MERGNGMKRERSLFSHTLVLSFLLVVLLPSGCGPNRVSEEETIRKVIHDSFAWGLTKDRVRFESVFAKDEDFFTYYPDSKSTVIGWNEFEKYLEQWMDPRNVVKGFEIRDLRLNLARSGNTAWFSAVVDDEGEWDGKPWGSKDIRWTGVLEKRNGNWVIAQQHMSEANDKVAERLKNSH